MSDLEAIVRVVDGMRRDIESLGDVKKMLASPTLCEALRDLHAEAAWNAGSPYPPQIGTLYFRGSPVIECDHLQGMEYSFVK